MTRLSSVLPLAVVAASSDSVTLSAQHLSNYGNAKCLSGSSAKYFFAQNPSPADHPIWFVSLDAVNVCDSASNCEKTCESRYEAMQEAPDVIGSQEAPSCNGTTTSELQITRSSGMRYWFYTMGAHVVISSPCLGDNYLGTAKVDGYYFHGAYVVEAIFKDLVKTYGLGSSGSPELVVLHGGSSGGIGAMHHLEKISTYVSSSNVYSVGIFDSSVPEVPCAHVSDQTGCFGVLASATVESDPSKGLLDYADTVKAYKWLYEKTVTAGWDQDWEDKCVSAFGDAEKYNCLFGEYRLQHLSRPYFQIVNAFDKHLLQVLWSGLQVSANVADDTWGPNATKLGDYIIESSKASHIPGKGHGFYLASCYAHNLGMKDDFFEQKAGGTTFKDAVHEWLWRGADSWTGGVAMNGGMSYKSYEDTCTEFSCGGGCTADCGGACSRTKEKHVPTKHTRARDAPTKRAATGAALQPSS